MRRFGLLVSLVASVGLSACGSSSGGGTGGGGGTGQGGAGGKGGTGGGSAGATGSGGTGGGSAGATGSGGTGGGSAGATGSGGGSAGATGSAGKSGSGGVGGSGVACGADTGTGSGETCSVFIPSGNCVTETFSAGTPPTPAGGSFSAGTYNLTSETAYVAADAGIVGAIGQVGRQTFVISNVTATSLTLSQAQSSGTAVSRSSGPVTITGMSATFTPTCPITDGGAQGGTDQFTASSSGFTLFDKRNNGAIVVSVFVKAP